MTSPAWDPQQYNRFERQRDRAALDLLGRLPDDLDPHEVWDVGCGTGQHAALLKRRWPQARVHGLDSSAAMLEQARGLPDAVDWVQADLEVWAPERPVDLLLANASLQWASDHQALFARLAAYLAPGGVMAVQMPMAWETRHHTLMRQTAAVGPWRDRLAGVDTIQPLLSMAAYYDALAGACDDIDIWSTTYLHVLEGEDAVLEWMKGTALRPYLTALADEPPLREAFLKALGKALAEVFPQRPEGRTLLPFPRLFLLGRASGAGAGSRPAR
ncbi:methyltransferase domain-containing protein [Brevundimonas naejangsanensis]|uniref:Methyltransferase domain-containing protein n=1 Tax=Brevundimonas naejangsanensis TaxID=588932 RepID=A0A494RGA6_9CAUL|nr:methyltransferase domain-containing protein [Brevundimonas naejangsanensis]